MLLGIALLAGGRWSLLGYLGVIAFHLAMLLFGWGVWLWAVPVLIVVVPVAWAYFLALRPLRRDADERASPFAVCLLALAMRTHRTIDEARQDLACRALCAPNHPWVRALD